MKNDFIIGPIRVPREIAEEYEAALKHYGMENPAFWRRVMRTLIHHHRKGDKILHPLRFRCYAGAFEEGLPPGDGKKARVIPRSGVLDT